MYQARPAPNSRHERWPCSRLPTRRCFQPIQPNSARIRFAFNLNTSLGIPCPRGSGFRAAQRDFSVGIWQTFRAVPIKLNTKTPHSRRCAQVIKVAQFFDAAVCLPGVGNRRENRRVGIPDTSSSRHHRRWHNPVACLVWVGHVRMLPDFLTRISSVEGFTLRPTLGGNAEAHTCS